MVAAFFMNNEIVSERFRLFFLFFFSLLSSLFLLFYVICSFKYFWLFLYDEKFFKFLLRERKQKKNICTALCFCFYFSHGSISLQLYDIGLFDHTIITQYGQTREIFLLIRSEWDLGRARAHTQRKRWIESKEPPQNLHVLQIKAAIFRGEILQQPNTR